MVTGVAGLMPNGDPRSSRMRAGKTKEVKTSVPAGKPPPPPQTLPSVEHKARHQPVLHSVIHSLTCVVGIC